MDHGYGVQVGGIRQVIVRGMERQAGLVGFAGEQEVVRVGIAYWIATCLAQKDA